jgi:hypothetical protein
VHDYSYVIVISFPIGPRMTSAPGGRMWKGMIRMPASPVRSAAMIKIRHQTNGRLLATVPAETLDGADLRGAYLRRAELAGANLRGANLYKADLSGANLASADLKWRVAAERRALRL